MQLALWQLAVIGLVLLVITALLIVWWRQQTFRWPILLAVCVLLAPALSWWSGWAFSVEDYRAGCDGLCPGYRGAPVPFVQGESAGGEIMPALFALNTTVYLVLLLAWSGALRAILTRLPEVRRSAGWIHGVFAAALVILPLAFAPSYIAPPEAHVRGDPQRVAINARRELYLYARQAQRPVLRVALEDVRPRRDGAAGLRVCLRAYTYFYAPNGRIYLDMTPEGVHSSGGGALPADGSCWD